MNQLPNKEQDALKNLFNDSMLEQPSDQFTASVMNKLNISPSVTAIKYEPVIGLNGWIFIAIITGLFFFLALSGTSTDTFSSKAILLQTALQNGTSAIENVFSGPIILLLALAASAVFALIGAESWYRQSRLRTT